MAFHVSPAKRGRTGKIVEQFNPRRGEGQTILLFRIVALPYLHDFRHSGRLLQDIIHDGSMRIIEPLVCPAQVAVRIQMEHAHARFPFGKRPDEPQRRTVVSSHEPHHMSGVEPFRSSLVNCPVQLRRSSVDTLQPARHQVILERNAALLQTLHDFLRIGPQAGAAVLHGVVDRHRSNPLLPGSGRHRVVKIELRGGFDDGIGPESGPSAIGGRHIPRYGEQHKTRILLGERKSEIITVIYTHSVRVEILPVHDLPCFILYNRPFLSLQTVSSTNILQSYRLRLIFFFYFCSAHNN